MPTSRGKSRLFVLQLPARTRHLDRVAVPTTLASLDGSSLDTAWPSLAALLTESGAVAHVHVDLATDQTYSVGEEAAARVALIANATDSLRSDDKIQAVVESVRAMGIEDVAFWLQKIVSDTSNADAHRKALVMVATA